MRRIRNKVYRGGKSTPVGNFFTRRRPTSVATNLTFETLEPRLQMAVVINEFLASNNNGLMDQDGDRPDWIELYNNGTATEDLSGWHLTDDNADLDKWEIPAATSLTAGSYLVIFASGKDRAITGQQLHTNFLLEQNGEFLALVMPDGTTIADSFAPFPEQLSDVSYGRGAGATTTDTLILESPAVSVHVPNAANAGLDTTWFNTGFVPTGWITGNAGVGFDNDADATNLDPYVNLNLTAQMNTSPLQLRTTAYIRIPFAVADPTVFTSLKLLIRYEDGFGLYLNGTRLTGAERSAPVSLAWNSVATATRSPQSDAANYVEIDLTASKHLLVAGNNVLAIHGLNRNTTSNDFLIDPKLVADRNLPPALGYMVNPSPEEENNQGTLGFVADTSFSVDRGFFSTSFNVEITSPTTDAQIRYTVDGSNPTATTGLVYNPLSPPLITTTTLLRAAAFKVGFTPTNIDTQTYIFPDHVLLQDDANGQTSTNWGYAGPDWAVDPDVVNNVVVANRLTADDLKAVPTVSLVMPWTDWFGPAGTGIYPTASEIEKPVSMEFFTADGTENHQIDGGIEIQGGTSDDRWKQDKLSLRIKFKQIYGDGKFDADIFNHPLLDDGAAASFNTLILDAQSNYAWAYGGGSVPTDQRGRAKLIQDQYIADLQNLAGGLAPHGRATHLYINGLYWGVYIVHERPDDSFNESYVGGEREDYDVIKHAAGTVVAPDPAEDPAGAAAALANYDAMLQLARQDMSVPANYEAVKQKVDIDGLIDYMLINYYTGNDDWPHHNWYASINREDPNGKWRFHSWDAEHVLKNVTTNQIQTGGYVGTPEEVHLLLASNGEYRLRFTDRVQKLMRDTGGLLTPTGAASVYQARVDESSRAMAGESARWGDSHTVAGDAPGAGNPYTLAHWLGTQNDLFANYFPTRTSVVLGHFAARAWTVQFAAPVLSQYGGTVTTSSQVSINKPGGSPVPAQIWYTVDGSDPRNSSTNLPSASAILYNGTPISFADGVGKRIQARIYLDGAGSPVDDWSPLVDQTFLMEQPFPVRISEINYHPAVTEDHEFIELMNTGSQSINLNGVQITQFATNPVILGSINLAAGQRIIVAKNPAAFQAYYGAGYNVLATGYDGNLSNGGELITLLGPLGEELQTFTYSDSGLWPTAADGNGPSLEIINPLGNPESPTNWRASAYVGGSPGASGVMGDFDGNGVVQDADYGVWRSRFGDTVAIGTSGDGTRDGLVDMADYIMWRKAMTTPAASAVVTATNTVVSEAVASIVVSTAAPIVTESNPQSASRPTLPAVDHVFTQFDSARPAFRPVLVSTTVSSSDNNNLLLATLVGRAALNDIVDTDIGSNQSNGDEDPIDRLLADWSGMDDRFSLN